MSEERVALYEAASADEALRPWRRELFDTIVRITAIVATPVALIGVYDLYTTQNYWMIPLALFAYAIVLGSTLVPRIHYAWRVWGYTSALVALGVADLISYGWGEDARIFLMAAFLFATIFLGRRHGLVALVIVSVILAVFIVAVGLGWFIPLRYPAVQYSVTTLITGLMIFVMLAAVLYTSFNYLFPRLFVVLQESTQLSRTLAAEHQVLSERTDALQAANLSLQRRAMYLDAGAQVSRALATVFDVPSLLEQAVTAISRNFAFDHVGIYLLDDTGDWAVLHAASSLGGRQMVAQRYRQRRGSPGLVGQALETLAPQTVVAVGDALPERTDAELPAARSAAALPLLVGGELLGILELQSTDEAAFDQDGVRALEGLAEQLAVAIDNARRFSDEAAVLEAQSPSYRLVRRLAMTHTEMEVYTAALAAIGGFSPAHAFVVRVPHGAVQAQLAAGLGDGTIGVQRVAELDIAVVDTLLAASVDLQAPLLLSDLTASLDASQAGFRDFCDRLVEQSDIRSVALVPMRVDTDLLGVLVVSYQTAHHFTPFEMQLYRIIEDLGGAALARIHVMQVAEARVERERWLREFGERVMRMPDLNTMMAEAAQALQDAVQADGVVVSIAVPEVSPVREDSGE